MSDARLDTYLHYGTNAERLAFTPDPPALAGVQPVYVWYETDTTQTWVYHTSWTQVSSGSGTVVGPGSSTDNAIARWDGATGALLQDSAPLVEDDGRISTVTDPTGLQDAATKNYVDTAISNVNVGGAAQNSFLVSGGEVAWVSDYIFDVSAAQYYIQGILYNSAADQVTLTAADPTNDRIDVIAVDNTGSVVVVDGTAAAQPSEPDIDPGTQLKLGIVLVTANTTEPADANKEVVYYDNAGAPGEWVWTSSGASIVVNSANNPKAPSTTCIEATTAAAGVIVKGIVGTPYDTAAAGYLILYIRSKAAWASNRGLTVTLRDSDVLVGSAVNINRTGTFGFNSATTGVYQLIAIPTVMFAIPAGLTIDEVRITTFGTGHGFYIDDIFFQEGGNTQAGEGLTQEQADARYLLKTNNLTDLASATTATAQLVNMVGDSGAGGTKGLAPAPGAGDAALGKFLKADGTWDVPVAGIGLLSSYYYDDTASDIATYQTLLTAPSSTVEEIDSVTIDSGDGETLIEAFAANDAIGNTLIPAGDWIFRLWRYVSSAAGISSIVIRVYSRTVPGGVETELFNATTGEINDTSVTLQTIISTQAAFTVNATDRLIVKLFGLTDAVTNRTISFTHNGTTHYSSFTTPIPDVINDFVGDSGAGGIHGLVPAPAAGDGAAGKYLAADGTWDVPPGSGGAPDSATYLTENDESVALANSRQVLAGDAVEFDDTVANQRTVNVKVDGVTVTINGSNELEAAAGSGITELTGDVTAGPGSGSQAATIANSAVTLAKIANAAANSKLVGSGAAGSGSAYSEISLGTNLSMSGTTLNATAGGGLIFREGHTASASATLDFTSWYNAAYSVYQIEIDTILPVSDGSNLQMQVSTDGGSTWLNTNEYSCGQQSVSLAGGWSSRNNGAAQAQMELVVQVKNTSTYGVRGWLHLYGAGDTAAHKSVHGKTDCFDSVGAVWLLNEVHGVVAVTTAINGIRFKMSSGNIASGTIRIYGLANS